ncbi:MAG: hypothetical protein ACUVXI_18085 [bacterium]
MADLPEMLDLLSALWQINSDYGSERERRTRAKAKDKHVAERLEALATNPLAGAFFYKQYSRLPDEPTPYPIYTRACGVLLERKGGDIVDVVKLLAEKSMGLFLPYPQYGRGKAHTYELVFREAVDALRKAPAASLDEMRIFAAGRLLKSLERRWRSRRGEGIVNPYREDLNQMAKEFIDLLVDEVLVKRADKSMAQFNRLANSFADAIYFEIDRNVSTRLSEWRAKYGKERASAEADPKLFNGGT